MSITLKLVHEDGIKLRQQSARSIERQPLVEGEKPQTSTEWRFDKVQASDGRTQDECQQDEDNRRVGPDGKKIKLGTYTVHVTAGMRNLVIERKGKVVPFSFKNGAIRNQMRLQYQRLEATGRKTKDGKPVHEWKNDGAAQYVPPNSFSGAFVGDGQRAVIDECPT